MIHTLLKSIVLLCLLGSLNLPLVFADVKVTVPPINPVKGDQDGKILLPGASGTASDQANYISNSFLPRVTSIVVSLSGGLSLLFVIISGIQILTSYTKEEQLASAKKTLTWALLGLIISILSYGIVQIIVSINLPK